MGMDYKFAGSASYPRFDREIQAIAEKFGGKLSERSQKRLDNDGGIDYWFGFLSGDQSDAPKFIFPEGTDATLSAWLNNPYEDMEPDETARVWELIRQYPEIEDISGQIWYELESLVELGEGWSIC